MAGRGQKEIAKEREGERIEIVVNNEKCIEKIKLFGEGER